MTISTLIETSDLRSEAISRYKPISSPAELGAEIPCSLRAKETVSRSRRDIQEILVGFDDHRLLVVCGPCSIHDVKGALDYAERLRVLAKEVEDDVLVVMRTYFEKPRSVIGWKGLVYDPDLTGNAATTNGLGIARRLLARVTEMGLPCATEFLNPVVAPYQEDFISYGSIGARTSESQIHRELVAGLAMPVGIKNNLKGDIGSAVNAVKAANQPHSLFANDAYGRPSIARVSGNAYSHVFLRGGQAGPNLDSDSIRNAYESLSSESLTRPVMVDCSHANSGKDYRNQGKNARRVTEQFLNDNAEIAGIMIESNLEEGSQEFRAGDWHAQGQSITDCCIGWKETECLIRDIACELKTRINRKKRLPSL